MTKKTHLLVNSVVTLRIICANNIHLIPFALIGITGAVLPDFDIKLHIKHRTVTHSLLSLVLTSIPFFIINESCGWIYVLNYALHLILDSFTKMGTPFLYPFVKKYYGPKLIRTGGAEDLFISLVALFLLFW